MHRLRLFLASTTWALLSVLSRPVAAQDQEPWNAHFQATYIRQIQPSFSSSRDGAHSLQSKAGASYSITGTASLGLRLGPSTEVYLDPEVAQGVALSGLVGLSEFPNGELAKTSGASLTLYPARLFVRHTFELGGERSTVDGGANQLKSVHDARRLTLTAGKVSVLDVFDNGVYAHDPRSQFMNWVLMTYGAYDYPADARGYTNGLAAEYDDGPWSVRFGRFAEPRTPNSLRLDNDLLRHYGDQLELTRTHEFGGLAGDVRVLAFRSRAFMGDYAGALAAAPADTAPTLVPQRETRVKRGIGFGVDQAVSGDVGVFLRALRADGKTETEAFTEADQSLAAGVSIKGARWSRGQDVVGLAVAADGIDGLHRDYLARGGQTTFLGDGGLNYGQERLAEVFYNAALGAGFGLTADMQRVVHPGYDRDRGPVMFYALRLHWES